MINASFCNTNADKEKAVLAERGEYPDENNKQVKFPRAFRGSRKG